jgi:HD-GYP domain-containing protein (c-di-GMP phosphodiesterase class II)
MFGSSFRDEARPLAQGGDSASVSAVHAVAQRLAREFGAPVGLLDPVKGIWLVRVGAEPEAFPRAGSDLLSALAAFGIGPNRTGVWRPHRETGPVWLGLTVPRSEGGYLTALSGFATSVAASDAASWGPVCPEPALRAWGQQVADRLRAEQTARGGPSGQGARPDGGARLLIARLIRRLRISDAPERFQGLATNALRNALNVAAVAWVPNHPHEHVVASGALDGLKGNGYRTLIPHPHHEPVYIQNQPLGPPGIAVRQVVAVAADTQGSAGWLLAANPLDDRPFATAEIEMLQPVASLIATQQTNARLYADLKELLFGVIRALTAAIDAKDPYTSGHSERVARIAVRLAEALGMSANQRSDLYLMGLLHDVGKIGIDDAVLKKTGPLTPEEYKLIQSHVEIGVHILADLKKLNHLLPGVKHHHESLDGTGYPCGLAGDAIPLEARILAVADSFDAMSSTRPYRRRLTPMQIDEILNKGSGVQWDPKVIDALYACRMEIEQIRQKGLGESLKIVVNETLGRS